MLSRTDRRTLLGGVGNRNADGRRTRAHHKDRLLLHALLLGAPEKELITAGADSFIHNREHEGQIEHSRAWEILAVPVFLPQVPRLVS